LAWDVAHKRAASEATVATFWTDGRFLSVRFVAKQRERVFAEQRTDNVGSGSDDEVWVDLWPSGTTGFAYQFVATPRGTHYQSSSENMSYEPTWHAHGTIENDGYTTELTVPIGAIRGAHGGTWRAQFVRFIRATGEEQVWSFGAAQSNPDDLAYAGTLEFPALDAQKPQPRLGLYGLGAIAAPAAGGSTSRAGADLSLPITATTSLYATFHPDYSNVELDQQSISPTAFARYYAEVRPFFTQGSAFYNTTNCYNLPCTSELYTPAIPTPSRGYAVEGRQGNFGFATFDAVGDGRNDVASVLDYRSSNLMWSDSLQRIAVTEPGLTDDVTTGSISFSDLKHVQAYAEYGSDANSSLEHLGAAQRYELGGTWNSQTFAVYANLREVGPEYQPVDGYVPHAGIGGYGLYANKIWLFSGNDRLQSMSFGGYVDRYQGPVVGPNQSDTEFVFDALTKNAIDLNVTLGSSYLRGTNGIYSPVTQSGAALTFHSGTQQESGNFGNHGVSATPTTISYMTGAYGNGRLDTWLRTSTFRIGARATVTLNLDDTAQRFESGADNVQWFESASYAYALGPQSSLAIGVRRVVGAPPTPNGGGDCIGTCSNISIAYHLRRPHDEIYIGYGDPNALTTTPQALIKYIFYVGAEKGT
jgi:hypothetical protein